MSSVNPHPRRPTLRQERAAVTRRRIRDAARALFVRDGYAATTLKAIAAEAEVAVQTVYAVFGSKAAILAELRSLVVDLPEADRALREAMREPTVERRLAGFAHSIRLRWQLAGDIVRVHEDAARVDPALRPGLDIARGRRQDGIGRFIRAIEEDLGGGLDVARTTAVVDALTMHDVYAQLVGHHRWSPDEYELWLAGRLASSIIVRADRETAQGALEVGGFVLSADHDLEPEVENPHPTGRARDGGHGCRRGS